MKGDKKKDNKCFALIGVICDVKQKIQKFESKPNEIMSDIKNQNNNGEFIAFLLKQNLSLGIIDYSFTKFGT